MSIRRAIIGGSGFTELEGFEANRTTTDTPYGSISGDIMVGTLSGEQFYFLPRHGKAHHLPPHKINYRANLYALFEFGVEQIVALAAVGAITESHIHTAISVPHQIIDYTWGRKHTFFNGTVKPGSRIENKVEHIEFTSPYDVSLRGQLIETAKKAGVACLDYAVYGITQGPRLETAAEIDKMEKEGVNIVGMTGMPEAALAKELGINYACLAMTVNPAAGRSKEVISLEMIKQNLKKIERQAIQILNSLDY